VALTHLILTHAADCRARTRAGKGGMGAFGPCEPDDVHFKSKCNQCSGVGTHAAAQAPVCAADQAWLGTRCPTPGYTNIVRDNWTDDEN
jgi:hypothetical protein